jgi:hypothetical protein
MTYTAGKFNRRNADKLHARATRAEKLYVREWNKIGDKLADKPACPNCKRPLDVMELVEPYPNGLCGDCYYGVLGREVEKHPICKPISTTKSAQARARQQWLNAAARKAVDDYEDYLKRCGWIPISSIKP